MIGLNNVISSRLEVLRTMIINSRTPPSIEIGVNVKAGFYGEEKVARYLKEAQFVNNTQLFRHVILDGAEIDAILINPRFICILEIKNITGELYFDKTTKQFYRIKNGMKEGMRNPELQLQRNVNILERRLQRQGLHVEIHGLIIFASRAGIVIEPPTLFPAIPIDALCDCVEQMEAKAEELLSEEHMVLVKKILASGEPSIHDEELLERLNLHPSIIKGGVRCQRCFDIGMRRTHSTWWCVNCGYRDRSAHQAAFQEYQLLFGREITVNDVKWWLGIDDKYLVSRLMKSNSEESQGRKNKRYFMKLDMNLLDKYLDFEMRKR